MLWGFISRYRPDATPETAPLLDKLVEYAIFYRDFVRPTQVRRAPTDRERRAMEASEDVLSAMPDDAAAEDIRVRVHETGKAHDFKRFEIMVRSLCRFFWDRTKGRAWVPSSPSMGLMKAWP